MPKLVQHPILQSLKYAAWIEYASELTSTSKGELFCNFCDCLLKSDKRFVVEARARLNECEALGKVMTAKPPKRLAQL